MKITISHCEVTLSAEIPEGSDIGQTLRAIRVLLVGVGFHSDLINQFLQVWRMSNLPIIICIFNKQLNLSRRWQ